MRDTQTLELGTIGAVQNQRSSGLQPCFESLDRHHREVLRLDRQDAPSRGEGTVSTTVGPEFITAATEEDYREAEAEIAAYAENPVEGALFMELGLGKGSNCRFTNR